MTDTQSALTTAIQSLGRSVVIGTTSALVGRGILTQDMAEIYIAAIPPILMAAWGVWSAYRAEEKTQVREHIAVQAGVLAERTNLVRGVAAESIGPEHAQEIIKTAKDLV